MGEVVSIRSAARSLSSADHLALRTLLKFMSGSFGIPYKTVCTGTEVTPENVKSYANEKAIKGDKLQLIFDQLLKRSSELLAGRIDDLRQSGYILYVVSHLLGEQWMRSHGLDTAMNLRSAPLDEALASWLSVADEETHEVDRRYHGLWRVLRASSPPDATDNNGRFRLADLNYSLLHIRPLTVGGGKLCDFRWYYLGRGSESGDQRVFDGFVIPNVNRIEFLARTGGRNKLLNLMSWQFASDPDTAVHTDVANGILLSNNSENAPLGAHVRAIFIHNSDKMDGEAFDKLREEERRKIGVKPLDSFRDLIPAEHYQRTILYLEEFRPIIGFIPTRRHNNDA